MGCRCSKVKNGRRKEEIQEDTVNSDVNNDVLKIYRSEKGRSNQYRSEKGDCSKDRRNNVSSNTSAKRWVSNSDPENEEIDCPYVIPCDGSKDGFPSMGYISRERRKNKRGEEGTGHERKNEQDSISSKGAKVKQEAGNKVEGKEIEGIKNNVDNNSFTGIIETMNSTLIKRESTARGRKEKGESPSHMEKKNLFRKKKIKFLYKTSKGKICTNGGKKQDPSVPPNESIITHRMKKKTKEIYNCLGSKKKEELLVRAIRKNKEQLLYYHDFRSMILRKNTFLHIYEFYKFNSNVFNLFSLMPSHIAENVHASKILFESSLIGNYIILPWIENDPDIKNNSYIKHVKHISEKKMNMEKDGTEDPCDREVNFCGLFNHNHDHKESDGNGENGENAFNNRNDNVYADEYAQRCNSPHDKHTSKNTTRRVLKKKQPLFNGNTERDKEKKYVSNRNLSMDNLFKLHLRKTSTARVKRKKCMKEVVSMQKEGAKKGAFDENNVQNKKVATNKEKFKKTEDPDEGKRSSLEGRERKKDQTNRQNGVTVQTENHTTDRLINRVVKEKVQKGQGEGPIRNNINGKENEQTDKRKRNHNSAFSAPIASKNKDHVESIGHRKKEEKKKNEKKKNTYEEEKKKKKKRGDSSTHVKRGKKEEAGLQSALSNNVMVTMNEKNIESRVDVDKEKKRKKKKTDGMKCKKTVRINMTENQVNGINCHVGMKEDKGEVHHRSSNNNRQHNDGGHIIRREDQEDYIAHGKVGTTNCNTKVMKRVKREVECHKMVYQDVTPGNKEQSSKDERGLQMENRKLKYQMCIGKNTKNEKVEGERKKHMISNKLEKRGYLREEKTAQEICEHKYGLNESSIKKNYVMCKKCYKKRCIYHYINCFKLYGWVNYKWTDPDGYLELSVRQKKKFDSWKRLSELYNNPIVMSTDLYNSCIRQGFVADCSFLSSLTVLIEYERKHKVPVLSNIISPCTSNYAHVNKNWPVFNPCGMYICRLHCNGIQRKIIIDDYVPVKTNNSLLVAYSNNQKELWVTLLEKAFVKLMGGSYSMYGSNPGSDLYYLTGWIPVTISLKSKISSSPPSLDRLTAHTAVNEVCSSALDASYGSAMGMHSPRKKSKLGFTVVRDGKRKKAYAHEKSLKKGERKNVINRKKSPYQYVQSDKNGTTPCSGGQLYTKRGRRHQPYDFLVGVNLCIHRLGTSRNWHPARADWSKYEKLKMYWTLRHLYATEERWKGKEKPRKAKIGPKCTVKKVNNADGTATKETEKKRTSMDGNPLCVIFPKMKKIPHCVRNGNDVKDILNEVMTDREVKMRHTHQFLCEAVSNMDLSSYVCGSIDQYSYLNQKGESSVLVDEEYEEYDEKWDIIWNNIYEGIKKGKCVVCLGTLELKDAAPSGLDYPEGVSLSTGIVTRHAYSILNIETYNGDKLLYIKNPWGCIRWKGKYSHHDEATWTKEVQKKLNYSLEKAKGKDDGCFWIPWKDVVKYFSHIYICWNSVIFPYQFEIHTKWENSTYLSSSILQDDTHLVAYNPQFALHVNVKKQDLSEDGLRYIGKKPIEIWILLSKHVRERKVDASQKYLALHIHSGKDRIVCPLFPIKQGIYSNGECTFTKLVIGGEDECINNYLMKKSSSRKDPCDTFQSGHPNNVTGGNIQNSNDNGNMNGNASGEGQQEILRIVDFVLIVSQYSQKEEFNFTLKVFSHTHLSIYELPPMLPENYDSLYFKGQWTSKCAGGCSNNLWSYFRNPHIRFYVPEDCTFFIFLECSQEHSVNLRIFKGMTSSPRSLKKGEIISSGAYKAGCCYIECKLESGIYCLIPSLYRANVTGDYQICIHYPKQKEKPVLHFIPYSYIVPPLSFFKYQLVHLYSLKNYSIILFHSTCVTLLSLRITFFEHMKIKGIPFVNIYKLVGSTDSYANDLETGNVMKNNLFNSYISHNRYVYKIVQKCNIHGGPGYDILPLSTCAYDYYIKFNSVLIPLVQVENEHTSYLLLITTNIKEDILYNHEVHFVSEKQLSVDSCYPVQA
ncbi:calpain, putative [Plasmodium knowlesi strain H]|uniref:Calpain, putative n=3 Tax=Plasmodium knowlesi TaxID=5850 RepID=A0A5K1VQT5_PLAKH|nr:calpain, putative [Plasmodium knowlesi strain H]OTN64372.1 putative Calpain [Plasmodium knowlesi]CAA9988918.1 calpain, putative [Plasmodium knowlesi strain H]SBO24763.1 calpain, putative [Plasmodium knowlesi strain H]SBO28027.1 calpain, putative [Plasmodium knowlesi strain H]VVS78392.1 calpain, putative [Plasmodium knowlesi strain H]|eukprot:XP_002261265.1 hypothetical protein, conserved in Plasmodium species [Plasmodium knowlesi strain H]